MERELLSGCEVAGGSGSVKCSAVVAVLGAMRTVVDVVNEQEVEEQEPG